MKKSLLAACVGMVLASPVYAFETSVTLGAVSDYRFNGISQTKGHPAVQGSVDLSFDNGIYTSVWASNVDFDDDAHTELDYYVGYGNSLTDKLSYDINLAHYSYPGYGSFDHIGQYEQLNTTLYYGNASLNYGYSPDYFNTSDEGHYVAVGYSYPLTSTINLDLHAGRSFGDYWKKDDVGEYEDYSIGLSTNWAGIDLSAAWLTNNIKKSMHANDGAFRSDNTIVVSASRTF